MIIPPAANCSGGDHEPGAIRAVLMPANPTPTKNNRIANFNPTIQFSALPITSALNRLRPVTVITLRLISTCLPIACHAFGKNVAP